MSEYFRYCARILTPALRAELLLHLFGSRANDVSDGHLKTRGHLSRLKLIAGSSCFSGHGGVTQRGRPTHFALTESGRGVAAALLAMEAERLVALGCADPSAEPITIAPEDIGIACPVPVPAI